MAEARSLRSNVRNPMLDLPAIAELRELPGETRGLLVVALYDIRADARCRADEAWRRNKGPMAAYWKAVAVYAGHLARAIR